MLCQKGGTQDFSFLVDQTYCRDPDGNVLRGDHFPRRRAIRSDQGIPACKHLVYGVYIMTYTP